MRVRIAAVFGRFTGDGENQCFLLFGDFRFLTSSFAVRQPLEYQLFRQRRTQFFVEPRPLRMKFFPTISPQRDAMFFEAELGDDVLIGSSFGGGEDDLRSFQDGDAEGFGPHYFCQNGNFLWVQFKDGSLPFHAKLLSTDDENGNLSPA